MDGVTAIGFLRNVLLGDHQSECPIHSVQKERLKQKQTPIPELKQIATQTCGGQPNPSKEVNYISHDEDEDNWDIPSPQSVPRDGP